MKAFDSRYVLVTPARNEAAFLPGLIESVASQTVLPDNWIIVSDGSTDETDLIAAAAESQYPFIRFVSTVGSRQRSFGSKARAFEEGYRRLAESPGLLEYAFIGNLDADVTFDAVYYERILKEMEDNPRLGVASGVCWDKVPGGFKCVTVSRNHAVGAVQFFRRECFESIGGYQSTTVGGMDSLAALNARMKGWQTRAFRNLPVYHHKPVDSANAKSRLQISMRAGMTEYYIGTHPLFAVAKALRRWHTRPIGVAVVIRLFSYFRLWVSRAPRDASPELVDYLKSEQLTRLRKFGKFPKI